MSVQYYLIDDSEYQPDGICLYRDQQEMADTALSVGWALELLNSTDSYDNINDAADSIAEDMLRCSEDIELPNWFDIQNGYYSSKSALVDSVIESAGSLDRLCDALEAGVDRHHDDFDYSELPVYGDTPEPCCTIDVWAWDSTHVLLRKEGDSSWYTDPRCACGEASFHCECDNG